jgi:hypothetical protein
MDAATSESKGVYPLNLLIGINSILIVIFQIHLGLVLEELSHQTGLAVLTSMFMSSLGLYFGQKVTIKVLKPLFIFVIPAVIATYALYLFDPVFVGLFISKHIGLYYILLLAYSIGSGRLTKYLLQSGSDVPINYYKLNATILISTLLFVVGMIFFEKIIISTLILLLVMMLYWLRKIKLNDTYSESLLPEKKDIYRLIIGGSVSSFCIYLILRYSYLYFFPIGFEYFIYVFVFMLIYSIPPLFIIKVRENNCLKNNLWSTSLVLILLFITSVPYLVRYVAASDFNEINYIFLVILVMTTLFLTMIFSSITLPVLARNPKVNYFEWSLLGNITGCVSSVLLFNFLDVNLSLFSYAIIVLIISFMTKIISNRTALTIVIVSIITFPFSINDREIIESGQLLRDGHRKIVFNGNDDLNFRTIILNHDFLSIAHYTVNEKDEFWGNGAYTSKIHGRHFQDKRRFLSELKEYVSTERPNILIMGAGNFIILSDILNNFNSAQVVVVDSFSAYENKDYRQFWIDRAGIKNQDGFKLINKDIISFLSNNSIKFDLIINNLTHPNYSTSSKVFTEDFSNQIANSLTENGIYYNNSFDDDLDCSFDKFGYNKYEVGEDNRFLIFTRTNILKLEQSQKCSFEKLHLFNNFKRRFFILNKYLNRENK